VYESPITLNGWTGSGYTMLDPDYGVGGYMISGGESGAFIALAIGVGLWLGAILSILAYAIAAGPAIFLSVLAIIITTVLVMRSIQNLKYQCGAKAFSGIGAVATVTGISFTLALIYPPSILVAIASISFDLTSSFLIPSDTC